MITERAAFALSIGLLVLGTGCPPPTGPQKPPPEPEEPADVETREFRHRRSRLVARLGSPRHTGSDVIAGVGGTGVMEGKFAYSDASKDLEDEMVIVELANGPSWSRLGEALTDDDGRARFDVPIAQTATVGPRRYRMRVVGDGTEAHGTIWVLPAGSNVAIFDIDGTLTPGDRELLKASVWGAAIRARPGGPDVAAHWRNKKVQPIYLTGRPYLFNEDTRRWLAEHGFAPGPLLTPTSMRSALPTTSGVGAFKEAQLRSLLGDLGLVARVAYGNAKTDVCAFARAGIDPKATFIFDDDLEACEGFARPNAIVDFRAHLAALR